MYFVVRRGLSCCVPEVFQINGIDANVDDFGTMMDCDPLNAPPYGCGDRRFLRSASTQDVLDRYRIDEDEYGEICDALNSEMRVGQCEMCL